MSALFVFLTLLIGFIVIYAKYGKRLKALKAEANVIVSKPKKRTSGFGAFLKKY